MLLRTTARRARWAAIVAGVVLATAGCGGPARNQEPDPPAPSPGPWVTNDESNSLTPIDRPPAGLAPGTGRRPLLYFAPDGSHAIVVADRLRRLDFRDPAQCGCATR